MAQRDGRARVRGVLIGTHTFAATGESARRQANGVESLARLTGVELVNVQFARDPHHAPPLETLPVLRGTSTAVSGRAGRTKPLMSEIFGILADQAVRRQLPYFAFTNADILIGQAAIDWILDAGLDTYTFSREDFLPDTGEVKGMELAGIDVFVMSTEWWRFHAHRFRPYIAAEGVWDNVYAAVMLTHSNGAIENRRPLVRHEAHPPGPMPSHEFGAYVNYLAALDAWYFDRWCRYWDELRALRARGASPAEEAQARQRHFAWPRPLGETVLQAARHLKARVRYPIWKLRHGATG